MGRFTKHGMDDQPLEGGGSGGGYGGGIGGKLAGATVIGSGAGIAALPVVAKYHFDKKYREEKQAKDEAPAEIKRESRGSTTSPMDQFMGELDKGFKDKGLDTTREGNNVTIKGAKKPKEEPMTAGQKQSMQEAKDEESYQKRKTAPTTKTEMGEAFAKGGMTASSRGDGCAQRGKTRGTVI
jgi:hypothetical protein